MKTFKLLKEDVKNFMPKLLVNNSFDAFLIRQAEINSFAKFEMSAILSKGEDDDLYWERLKPYIYNIIKGNVLPKSMKIVFNLDKEEIAKISENFTACFLNLNYENGEVIFTTGTSTKTFDINRSDDILFDEYIDMFFELNKIPAIDINKL